MLTLTEDIPFRAAVTLKCAHVRLATSTHRSMHVHVEMFCWDICDLGSPGISRLPVPSDTALAGAGTRFSGARAYVSHHTTYTTMPLRECEDRLL